jgi:hypothetical protein
MRIIAIKKKAASSKITIFSMPALCIMKAKMVPKQVSAKLT